MKRLILLIIILALALGLFAEEAIIGTGYETQRFPLGSYYGYERSAALYKADEIGAGSISISKLAWYATINTTASVPTKIYLKRTSASTLTASTWANMISGASLRYNQTKTGTGANGWNVYHLDSPFDLGMGENLIVMVETNYGGSGSDSAAGGGSGGGGIHSSFEYDTHLTWWGDNSAPTGNNNNTPGLRPNVKLYYTNSDLTPSSLPFTEDWASGNLTSNDWTIEDNTWGVVSNLGNPAPSVRFNYSPHLSDYSSALYSRDFDARGMNSVEFSFDLYLDNHDDSVENVMSWEIWYGDTWISLGSYSSVDGDLPWTHYSYNISEISAIPMFKIRFLASGEQNFFINKWLIDNIYLGAPAAITLPFTEDWESLIFGTNFWTIDSENWRTFYVGENPDAAASFFYLPGVTDYSSALTSYDFDATGMSSVQFSFDLFLDNHSTSAENKMTWQIWNGSTWHTLGSYSSLSDDLPWTHYSYDVSAYASNRIFKIRFVASGVDSYEINGWYIDNIKLGAPTGGLGTVTNLVISKSATRILLNGNSVPGATWYSVYYSEDPDDPFVLLGTVDTAIASFGINLSSLPGSKYFFKMTAGNGPWPSGSRLDNAPVSSSNIISQPDLTTNPQLNQSKPSKGLRPN